ncbi:chromate transporter, partial [Micromonospora sp. KC207]|uniref:chromate transporter n=1 Tax=Micromonospora sp. KC207 TaxID=2530377 RepID=UPI00104406CF
MTQSSAPHTDEPTNAGQASTPPGDVIPFRQALGAWTLISLQTFGGPAGQIAVMQRTLVDEKRWIGQQRFLHALNYCMLLPGPEAQQLSIYVGWLLNGVRGGLAAGTLFVLPGALAMLALSAVYVRFGDTTIVTALFNGIAPAILAIVAHAVWRVG